MAIEFLHNGVVVRVHTEVGDGLTRVVVEEQQREVDLEPQGDEQC